MHFLDFLVQSSLLFLELGCKLRGIFVQSKAAILCVLHATVERCLHIDQAVLERSVLFTLADEAGNAQLVLDAF